MPNSFTTTYLIYPSLEMPIYFYFKLKTRDIVYFLQLYLFAKHIMCLKLDMLRFMQFSFLFLLKIKLYVRPIIICRPRALHSGIGRPIILFFLLSYMGQAQPAIFLPIFFSIVFFPFLSFQLLKKKLHCGWPAEPPKAFRPVRGASPFLFFSSTFSPTLPRL